MTADSWDFLVSCTEADRAWAEWVARELGDLGYRILVQAGDVPDSGVPGPERTIRVQSADWESRDPPAVSLTDLSHLSPAAAELLRLLAWMAPAPVPLDLFPDAVEAVGTLVRLRFARRSSTHLLIAHLQLRWVMRARGPCRSVEVQQLLEAGVPRRIDAAPAGWPWWQVMLPHVLAVADDVENDPARCATTSSGWLVDRAATYLKAVGRSGAAVRLFERALAIIESVHGRDSLYAASTLHNLGEALVERGRPAEAAPLIQRSLAVHERTEGEEISVANNLDCLAKAYSRLRRPAEAIELMNRALTIWEAALGRDHPDVGVCLHNLALAYNEMNRYDKSVPLLERAVGIDVSAYGPDDVSVAISLDALGVTLRNAGRPLQAVSSFERALAIYDAADMAGHPNITACLKHLADAFTDLGRHDEARDARARAIGNGAAS